MKADFTKEATLRGVKLKLHICLKKKTNESNKSVQNRYANLTN